MQCNLVLSYSTHDSTMACLNDMLNALPSFSPVSRERSNLLWQETRAKYQ